MSYPTSQSLPEGRHSPYFVLFWNRIRAFYCTRLEVSPKLAITPNAIYGKTPKRQRTQEEMMEGLVQLTYGIANDVSAIKGWVTFLGVLALIGLIFGLISSCGALLGL